MATDADSLSSLRPAEFCALQRQLVTGMTMRKKRNLKMGPIQQLKLDLLAQVEAADPDPAEFDGALSEAILAVSGDQATGPAQAVASDIQMDWQLACQSHGFVEWLRTAARDPKD